MDVDEAMRQIESGLSVLRAAEAWERERNRGYEEQIKKLEAANEQLRIACEKRIKDLQAQISELKKATPPSK